MLLSVIEKSVFDSTGQTLGFVVQSKKTGNSLKVIAKTPSGKYLVVALTGKKKDGEFLVENSDRYELVADADTEKVKRMTEIKVLLQKLGAEGKVIEDKMVTLENELETLEEVG